MHPTPQPLTRTDYLLAALLAAALLTVGGTRAYLGASGFGHDDAIYVLTGKALAEGQGYRLINLPDAPPQTKYPILYPAVLALVWMAWPDFPANLAAMQVLSLVCAAATLALAYLYLVRFRYASRGPALLAGLLCATTPMFVYLATVPFSEMLFALLTLVALWALEHAARSPVRGSIGLGVLLALPTLCRSIGVVFLPPALLLLWRGKRPLVGTLLGVALTLGPWFAWRALHRIDWQADPVEGYYTDYLGWWAGLGLPQLMRTLTLNIIILACYPATAGMEGLNILLTGQSGPGVFLFAPLGLITIWAVLRHGLRGRALGLVLLFYLGAVVAWPWPPPRFLVPFLVVLLALLAQALADIPWPGVFAGLRRPVLAGAVAAALFGNVLVEGYFCRDRYRNDCPLPEVWDEQATWQRHREVMAWVGDHTAPDDLLVSGSDAMLSLYTGRKAFYPIVCPPHELFYGVETDEDQLLAQSLRTLERRQPRYLVVMPLFHGEERFRAWVDSLRTACRDRVVPAFVGDDPRYVIYELRYPLQPDVHASSVPAAHAARPRAE